MDQRTLEWLQLLARVLLYAGGAVIALSLLAAIQIATSDTELAVFSDLQEQSRALGVFATIAGGITAAGVLAGLGGILRLQIDARERALRDAGRSDA